MLRSSVIVTIVSLLAAVLGFANQLVIAGLFGASGRLDAYLVGVSVPLLLIGLVGGMFSFWLVPLQVQQRADMAGYPYFSSLLLASFILCAALISALAEVAGVRLLHAIAPSLSESLLREAAQVARVSWLTFSCSLIVFFLSAMHNAAKRFYLPVLANAFPYVGLITGGLLAGHRLGPVSLAWGNLFGCLASVALLYPGCRGELRVGRASLGYLKVVTRAYQLLPLVVMSILCFTVYGTVDAIWATRLGTSQLSILGYSQRLLVAASNLVILGPMTVILPHLSEAAVQGHYEEFNAHTTRALRMVLTYAAAVAAIVSVVALPLVELALQRGAFDHQASVALASILPTMLVGLVALLGATVLLRALHAKRDVAAAAVIGALGAGLYFVLSGLLSQVLQLSGIALAYSVTWWVLLLIAFVRVYRQDWGVIVRSENLRFVWQIVVTSAICLGTSLLADQFWIRPITEVGWLSLFARLAATAGLGGLAFFIMSAVVFKMPEATAPLALLPIQRCIAFLRNKGILRSPVP